MKVLCMNLALAPLEGRGGMIVGFYELINGGAKLSNTDEAGSPRCPTRKNTESDNDN
jgi:hypothetical protein